MDLRLKTKKVPGGWRVTVRFLDADGVFYRQYSVPELTGDVINNSIFARARRSLQKIGLTGPVTMQKFLPIETDRSD